VDALGFIAEFAGGEVDVGAGDFNELAGGIDVEKSGADLLVDLGAEVVELGIDGVELGLGGIDIAAEASLTEDGNAESADGREGTVGTDTGDVLDAVIAAERKSGQALAAIRGVDGAVLDQLVLKILIVLAVLIGDGADFLRGLGGEVAVGSAIGEDDFLSWVESDFALEQDEVFLGCVFGDKAGLLLGLVLDAGAELIEIGGGAGNVLVMGVAELELILLLEGAGVVDFTGGCDGVEISGSDLLDDFSAGGHFGEVSGAGGGSRGAVAGDYGTRKEGLFVLKLALGEGVLGDERKAGRDDAAGKEEEEGLDEAGTEAEGGEVVLIKAGVAGEGDGGEELLERLGLLGVDGEFLGFDFLEAKVGVEAAADGVVEGELEDFVGGGL